MASRRATITIIPASLAEAMQTTLALPVQGEGQWRRNGRSSPRSRTRSMPADNGS